jgi:hypothetical protein
MNITREVIVDLWSVYTAGEASADTCALVEEFLSQDTEFAHVLRERGDADLLESNTPILPPDREAQALNQTKRLLHGLDWSLILLLSSISFTAQAFGRIIADTSWDVSPRNFIIMAIIAAVFWCAYLVRRAWIRRKFYRKNVKPGE